MSSTRVDGHGAGDARCCWPPDRPSQGCKTVPDPFPEVGTREPTDQTAGAGLGQGRLFRRTGQYVLAGWTWSGTGSALEDHADVEAQGHRIHVFVTGSAFEQHPPLDVSRDDSMHMVPGAARWTCRSPTGR